MSERFAVCAMHGTMVDSAFMDSLVQLITRKHEHGALAGVLLQETGVGICEGRNLLAAKFMQTGIEWMLMLDSDMAFQPNLFDRLIQHATKDTVVTGIYFAWNRHTRDVRPTIYDSDLQVIKDWTLGKPFEIGGCGAGCMLIHRSVFEKIPQLWFTQAFDGSHLEDIGFCINASTAGIKIVCDPSIPLGHCKGFIVGQGDYLAYKEIKDAETGTIGTAQITLVGS